MDGAIFEVLPVFWGGMVARAAGELLWDVDMFAGEPPGDLFPEELYASLLEVSGDARGVGR